MMLISESRQLIKQLDFDNFRHLTLSSASSHPQITQRYIFQAVLLEKSLLENEACMMAHRSPISFYYTHTHTKKKKKKKKEIKKERKTRKYSSDSNSLQLKGKKNFCLVQQVDEIYKRITGQKFLLQGALGC
jgi:uncharacterized membrane protein YfhO